MEKLSRNSTALIFQSARDKAIKLLSYSILMRTFQNWPNELISCYETNVSRRFHVVSFVCK